MAELQNSKARLVEDITKQLQVNYDHQILNLKNEAAGVAKRYEIRLKDMQLLTEEKIKMANQSGGNTTVYWILIIIAIIVGGYRSAKDGIRTLLSADINACYYIKPVWIDTKQKSR